MIEQEQSDNLRQLEIKDLTSALINALGIKPSQEGEKIQSASIFLEKLFRKYSSQTGKRFNQVKLSRLNGMLFKVCKEPPSSKTDIELIYQIILSFMFNEGGNLIDDNSYATNTCIWIAKFLQEILSKKQTSITIQFIETLLKIKKPVLMAPQIFQKNISESSYFKDKQITKSDQLQANQKTSYRGFMSQFSIYEQIKQNFNLLQLFENLYNAHTEKAQIFKLFINFFRQTDVQNMREIFIDVFVKKNNQTKQTLSCILNCLDTQFFSANDFHQIVKLLLTYVEKKLFLSLPIKNIKCQNKLMDILAESIKVNTIDQLADIFMSEKQVNNYYIIYLINKSNQKLSYKYLNIPLNKTVSNREAIICSLAINHNLETSHKRILKIFFDNENILSNKQKLDLLKIAHFSYINVPKSHLLTHIIKSISVSQLDVQSNFQFLPTDNYQKKVLDKNERQQINDFLSRYFGNSDQVYKIKLDLYAICGKQLPYMQDFKKIQKIFQAPVDQIVTQLPNIPDNLIEVALMGINNKLNDQFIVNYNLTGPVVQWALDCHKKQCKKYKNNVEALLKKINSLNLLQLCLQVFEFNLDQKQQLIIDQDLRAITSAQNYHKLNGVNFSEYFMSSHQIQNQQNQATYAILKSKNLVIQYQKLIKFLSNESKVQNRKQLKTIVSQESSPIRALKIIKLLSQSNDKIKKERLKKLTQTLLQHIRPDFQYLKQLSSRSGQLNIQYIPINQSLQFLLSVNYQKAINFISKLLKSGPTKIEEKTQKIKRAKKKNNNNEQITEKSSDFVLQNIQFCFRGDPNSLPNYQSIISIIQQIKAWPSNQDLKQQVVNWLTKIKMFHKQNFRSWRSKVNNYTHLWQCCSSFVQNIISNDKIQKHFLMMIDLLNKLYQEFKLQKQFLQVEKKLLNAIYLLYLIALNKKDATKIQEQNQIQKQTLIPQEKLNQVIANYQPPQVSVSHIFHCIDCSKKVCSECAPIIHKNHDKNYIGVGNQADCHKSIMKGNKQMDRKGNNNSRQRNAYESHRQLEKLIAFPQGGDKISPQIIMKVKGGIRDRQAQYLLQKKNQRLNMQNMTNQGQLQQAEEEDKKKQKQNYLQCTQKHQIRSCSQKEFSLNSACILPINSKPKPTFETKNYQNKEKKQCLNLAPLFNLLVRELKSDSFFESAQKRQKKQKAIKQAKSKQNSQNKQKQEKQTKQSKEGKQAKQNKQADQKIAPETNFQAEVAYQKYLMLKLQLLKNNLQRMPGNPYLSGQQQVNSNANSNLKILTRKNSIAVNDKIIAILAGNSTNNIFYLQMNIYKAKFIKKQSQKSMKQPQNLDGYHGMQNKLSEPSSLISQILFNPSTHNLLAEVSPNRILFEQISRDGRNRLIKVQKSNSQIIKFQWLKSNSLRNVFIYLSNQIVITKIGKRQYEEYKIKIPVLGSKIKDFTSTTIGSRNIVITVVDVHQKLYRAKIDLYNKKIPNFQDFKVNFCHSENIISINSHGSSVYCVTSSGKFLYLSINQDNELNSFVEFPIIQGLRNNKISDINLRYKQINRIRNLCVITQNQNQIYAACLLVKQSPNDSRKVGFFTIINLNIQNNKIKVVFYADNGLTDSFDYINLSQKQFMFVCLQEDGQLWSIKLNTQPKSYLLKYFDFTLVPNQISKYVGELKRLNIMDQIQFYSKQRKYSFKQNLKLTDHFKIGKTDSLIKFEQNQKQVQNFFITAIELSCILSQQPEISPPNISFNFLSNSYTFSFNKARQIQLPLTVKEALSIYLGHQELKIQFSEGNAISNVKDIVVYGVKVSDNSVYYQALTNLSQLMFLYNGIKDLTSQKKIQRYFLNQLQTDIKKLQYKSLQEYFNKKKLAISEQNLLFKLQLFRQSLLNQKIERNEVHQCFQSIRNYILPNCHQKRQLMTSAYKLCRSLTQSTKSVQSYRLGSSLNYQTHLDIYTIFRIYKIFRIQSTIDNFQDLLTVFCRTINSRTLNAFIIFGVYPDILRFICAFFKKIMSQYKSFFKTNDTGLERQQKVKLNRICSQVIRIILEYYQFKKNKSLKDGKNCQEQLLKIFQHIFCLTKKQIHRQIKLNPFEYLVSWFEDGVYILKNPSINYLQLQKLQVQQPKKSILQSVPLGQQQKKKLQQQNAQGGAVQSTNAGQASQNTNLAVEHHQDQGRSNLIEQQLQNDNQDIYQQSCQEHKQPEEQNREMIDEFAYELQQEIVANNLGIQKMGEEEDEQMQIDKYELKTPPTQLWKNYDINSKKIYDYLCKQSQAMVPEQLTFQYFEICQHLLLQIFSGNSNSNNHKYLNSDNLVLYVGLVYNLLLIIEKKLNRMFNGQRYIDPTHTYIRNNMFRIIQTIDSKIDNHAYSVLYLPINSIINFNIKTQKLRTHPSMFVQSLILYYRQKMNQTKLFKCLISDYWHPQRVKPAASLSSVLRFQYFDLVNPAYQLKFVGNLFLNLRNSNNLQLQESLQEIKVNLLKLLIKYNMRIFYNIMVKQNWIQWLQKTKIIVGFEQLQKKPLNSLKSIINSIGKNVRVFVQIINEDFGKITILQNMLGLHDQYDHLLLDILDAYYAYQNNKSN